MSASDRVTLAQALQNHLNHLAAPADATPSQISEDALQQHRRYMTDPTVALGLIDYYDGVSQATVAGLEHVLSDDVPIRSLTRVASQTQRDVVETQLGQYNWNCVIQMAQANTDIVDTSLTRVQDLAQFADCLDDPSLSGLVEAVVESDEQRQPEQRQALHDQARPNNRTQLTDVVAGQQRDSVVQALRDETRLFIREVPLLARFIATEIADMAENGIQAHHAKTLDNIEQDAQAFEFYIYDKIGRHSVLDLSNQATPAAIMSAVLDHIDQLDGQAGEDGPVGMASWLEAMSDTTPAEHFSAGTDPHAFKIVGLSLDHVKRRISRMTATAPVERPMGPVIDLQKRSAALTSQLNDYMVALDHYLHIQQKLCGAQAKRMKWLCDYGQLPN